MKVGWYRLWKNEYAVKGITKCFMLIQGRQYSFVQVLNLVWKKSINLHIKLYFHIPLTEFSIISSLSCPETYFTKLNLSAPSAKSTFTFLIVFTLENILHQHIQFASSTHKSLWKSRQFCKYFCFLLQIGEGWIRGFWHQDTKVALFLNY